MEDKLLRICLERALKLRWREGFSQRSTRRISASSSRFAKENYKRAPYLLEILKCPRCKLPPVSQRLHHQLIWITGASAGIGRELALLCARHGARLILSARNESALREVAAQCTGAPSVDCVPLDLSDYSSLRQAVERVREVAGTPDILIHNGGISQRGDAEHTSFDVDERLMRVNYFGPVLLTKLVLPEMLARGSGRFVVISSFAGKWGFYQRSAYSASKHALHGFFESLRLETEGRGIRVHLVTPGFIATAISVSALNEAGNPTGEMDQNQAKGLPPDQCAQQILNGVLAGKEEFGVGGKELRALWVHRLFPKLFGKILRRQSPR